MLWKEFEKNKNLYAQFREEQIEFQQKELNFTPDDGRDDNSRFEKKNDESLKAPVKCVEFCKILCSLAEIYYKIENIDILVHLVKIMKILGRYIND